MVVLLSHLLVVLNIPVIIVCVLFIFHIGVCNNRDIRLAGSSIIGRGRVEICWNETWGTVCDDFWSSSDAIVACRQLGYPTTGKQ